MELPSEEGEMPLPLNSTYGHGHMIQHHHHHHPAASHNHIIPSSAAPGGGGGGGGPHIPPSTAIEVDDHVPSFKKTVRYRECLKNHAAAMGGNATDGCGEFMPSGEEGTLEALTCSACNCHRNFHRKEVEGDPSACDNCSYHNNVGPRMGRKLFHHHPALGYHPGGALISSRAVAPHPMIMSYNMGGGSDQSEEQEGGGVMVRPPVKKRFRTKFTTEQKEKMLNFAEKVGWKIQKQEEGVVQQFCQEVGVKRRVLKVWMHNNKHNLAKKNIHTDPPQNQL